MKRRYWVVRLFFSVFSELLRIAGLLSIDMNGIRIRKGTQGYRILCRVCYYRHRKLLKETGLRKKKKKSWH
jgi:hypothetical protein